MYTKDPTNQDHRSALDFNPINTIASHLQYWQDEDVTHFIVSQLLSRRSEPRTSAPALASGPLSPGLVESVAD